MEEDGLNQEFICDNCGCTTHKHAPKPDDAAYFDARDLDPDASSFFFTCEEVIVLKVMHS